MPTPCGASFLGRQRSGGGVTLCCISLQVQHATGPRGQLLSRPIKIPLTPSSSSFSPRLRAQCSTVLTNRIPLSLASFPRHFSNVDPLPSFVVVVH